MEYENINCKECYNCENCCNSENSKCCKKSSDVVNCKYCLCCHDCFNCINCYNLRFEHDLNNIIKLNCFSDNYYEITDKSFNISILRNKNPNEIKKFLKKIQKKLYIKNDNCVNCIKCNLCDNCVDCVNCIKCESCRQCYGVKSHSNYLFCLKNIIEYKNIRYKDITPFYLKNNGISEIDYSKLNDNNILKLITSGEIIKYDDYIDLNNTNAHKFDTQISTNVNCKNCFKCRDCYGLTFKFDFERIIKLDDKYYEDFNKVLDIQTLNNEKIQDAINKGIIKLVHTDKYYDY